MYYEKKGKKREKKGKKTKKQKSTHCIMKPHLVFYYKITITLIKTSFMIREKELNYRVKDQSYFKKIYYKGESKGLIFLFYKS